MLLDKKQDAKALLDEARGIEVATPFTTRRFKKLQKAWHNRRRNSGRDNAFSGRDNAFSGRDNAFSEFDSAFSGRDNAFSGRDNAFLLALFQQYHTI